MAKEVERFEAEAYWGAIAQVVVAWVSGGSAEDRLDAAIRRINTAFSVDEDSGAGCSTT